jgi:putative two-component system response regulator
MICKQQILGAKILIVDDNKTKVLLLEKMLASEGYTNFKSITDSRKASDVYRDFRPDIVLLDIRMPEMDGFQIMEQLKQIERDSYIPVLILTAYQEYETRLRALKLGAKDFLTKPLDRLEALTRIHNLLEVRLLHNRARDQNKTLDKKNPGARRRTKPDATGNHTPPGAGCGIPRQRNRTSYYPYE